MSKKATMFGDVKVEGLEELCRAFLAIGEEALPYLKEAADNGASITLAEAKEKAPADSGDLKAALKVGKARKSKKYPYRVFAKVTFSKKGAHGVPVELGHHLIYMGYDTKTDVKERPFLRPAADSSRDEVQDILINGMNKAIEQIGGEK